MVSTAVVAAVGNGAAFRRGRDFAAWLGLAGNIQLAEFPPCHSLDSPKPPDALFAFRSTSRADEDIVQQ